MTNTEAHQITVLRAARAAHGPAADVMIARSLSALYRAAADRSRAQLWAIAVEFGIVSHRDFIV